MDDSGKGNRNRVIALVVRQFAPSRIERQSLAQVFDLVCHDQQNLTDSSTERHADHQSPAQRDRELLRHPELLRHEYERRLASPDNSVDQQSLAKQLRNTQRTISRLVDAYADGVITREEFEPRIKRARKRHTDLKAKLDVLQSQTREQSVLREALAHLDTFAGTIHAGLGL